LFGNEPFVSDHVIVYAKYCDGGSWTGENFTETIVNGKQIYYRGRLLLDELFLDLDKKGLLAADTVVYSGCSAGALTTYAHLDYVHEKMVKANPAVTVVGLADAMFSLQYHSWDNRSNYYTGQMSWGFTAWNSSRSVNQECLAHHGGANGWVCLHGAISAQYVTTPLLVVNSKFDTWQERGVLSLNTTDCPATVSADGSVLYCKSDSPTAIKEGEAWKEYGAMMVAAMDKVPQQHGAFLTNCPGHCQTGSAPTEMNPAEANFTLHDTIMEWYPLVVQHGKEPGFKAPRHMASATDNCYHPPATPLARRDQYRGFFEPPRMH